MLGEGGSSGATGSVSSRAGLLAPSGPSDGIARKLVRSAIFPGRTQPVQIGRFTVLKRIGQGGMGVVYACYDDQLDRKIAVKILHVGVIQDLAVARARLLREAQAMARLSHPNIVGVHEVGQADDMVFVAMEFVQGVTLDEWVAKPRTWQAILSAFLQAGRGLEAAHRGGIVHRDFKPGNVMVADDGAVKVLDFGLARASEGNIQAEFLATQSGEPGLSDSHLLLSLTRTGLRLGTPAYMSPEQHRGEVAAATSDQFSFCVALYQCLYGKLPFSTNSIEALRDDVMRGHVGAAPPQSPVPARIFKVLRRGMMVESDQRFASMAELLTALERDPGALYRRVTALTMTAVVTGAAGFTMAGGSAIEVCPDAHAELAGVWDAERAGAVHASVHATASAQAGEMLARVEPQLAGYADTWARLRRDACTAHAEGRHSTQLFDLQTSCLAQRRASLDALVDKLVTASAAELNPLMQATAKLPALDTCADAEALMAAVPPPEEKELRVRVQGHREGLARAQVYEDTGQYRLGLEVVDGILADRDVRGYAPLLAEAWLRKGGLQMQGGDLAAAEQALTTAVLTAIACGHDSVVAQASSRRGFLFMLRGRLAQAQAALPEISAFNQRVQRNIDGYAEFLEYAAAIQWMGGENDKAWRTLEEALALLEQHGRLETPRSLGILHNLGMANRETGRYEAAADIGRRVIRLSDQLFGPAYPKRTLFEVVLSHNLRDLGRPREAYAGLSRLAANFTRMESKRSRVDVLTALGIGALAEGAGGVAWRYLIDALRLDPEYFGAQANYWTLLMWAAAETGDAAAMQRYHDEALDRLAQPLSLEDVYYQMFLLDHGRALGALGRFQEAIEPLERLRAGLAGSESVVALRNAAEASLELGKLRVAIGELEAAEEAFRQALAGFERVLSPRNLELAVTQMALGELALARGRFDEAVMWLAGAESIFGTTAEADYPPLARARFALARARTGAARSAAPTDRALAELALAALRANARMDEARAVEVWLAEHR